MFVAIDDEGRAKTPPQNGAGVDAVIATGSAPTTKKKRGKVPAATSVAGKESRKSASTSGRIKKVSRACSKATDGKVSRKSAPTSGGIKKVSRPVPVCDVAIANQDHRPASTPVLPTATVLR